MIKRISSHAKEVEAWWAGPRWRNAQRDWNAEDIVRLRGSQPTDVYASNAMAQKFWEQIDRAQVEKRCKSTFGALDAVQAVQMAKYLDTVYVSGWQSSSTAASNNLCGPDLADYCYDTVPKKVDQLFRAQQFHDRKQYAVGGKVDYMNPIVADGDAGHGGITAVMKLTQMMIEAGAAGIHLEDQRAGAKKCGHMGGKVLCSTREHIARLKAARVQADIMGTDTIIIARTDAKSATLLDNDIDDVDKPYILGRSPWSEKPVTEKKAVAGLGHLPTSWTPLRTTEGYYRVEAGLDLAIDRAVAYAPYADMLWCELDTSSLEDAKTFADGVLKHCPDAKLAINNSPSFNWSTSDLSDNELKEYHFRLGEMGYVWSFITLAGFHVNGLAIDRFARDFAQNSMLAYTRNVQEKEREEGVELLKHQKWSGSELIDLQMQTVLGKDYSTAALGGECTEHQFN